jgi:hypothetical protein
MMWIVQWDIGVVIKVSSGTILIYSVDVSRDGLRGNLYRRIVMRFDRW